jgi:hypothetical protein
MALHHRRQKFKDTKSKTKPAEAIVFRYGITKRSPEKN